MQPFIFSCQGKHYKKENQSHLLRLPLLHRYHQIALMYLLRRDTHPHLLLYLPLRHLS